MLTRVFEEQTMCWFDRFLTDHALTALTSLSPPPKTNVAWRSYDRCVISVWSTYVNINTTADWYYS